LRVRASLKPNVHSARTGLLKYSGRGFVQANGKTQKCRKKYP
jgi:hypothetical protein